MRGSTDSTRTGAWSLHRVRWLVVLFAAALTLAGCGADKARTSESSTVAGRGTDTSAPSAPEGGGTGTSAPSTPRRTDADPCADAHGWGSGARRGGTAMSPAAVYLVRAGQHGCYDRVVFDLNGEHEVGYTVSYVPVVTSDPRGEPVPVAGDAVLQVVVRAPILGADSQGHQPWRTPPAVGANMVDPATVAGWASLAGVKFAGSFEGQTTFAVGATEQLPFRVLVSTEPGYRHLIVDLAH